MLAKDVNGCGEGKREVREVEDLHNLSEDGVTVGIRSHYFKQIYSTMALYRRSDAIDEVLWDVAGYH